MFSKGLLTASDEYIRLKHHRGHWHNHEYHPAIDNHGGERHQAMIELQSHLGKVGTPVGDIEHLMGRPTKIFYEPDETILTELKRHHENYKFPEDAAVWVYEWRGNHDYVYFVISKDNKVIQSAWYYAYE